MLTQTGLSKLPDSGSLCWISFRAMLWRNHLVHGPRAFAQDARALALAQELVARGDDAALPLAQRHFACIPYMHSESIVMHQEALRLFAQAGLEDNLRFERSHLAILKRFWGENRRRKNWRFCRS